MKAIQEFKKILDKFDAKYQELADYYSIECERCARCCREPISLSSPFELLWLKEHFDRLDVDKQEKIINRAEGYIREANERGYVKRSMDVFDAYKRSLALMEGEKLVGVKCPLLDEDNSCILYKARPITCREFGVPAVKRPRPRCFHKEIDKRAQWLPLHMKIRRLELKYGYYDEEFSKLLPEVLLCFRD